MRCIYNFCVFFHSIIEIHDLMMNFSPATTKLHPSHLTISIRYTSLHNELSYQNSKIWTLLNSTQLNIGNTHITCRRERSTRINHDNRERLLRKMKTTQQRSELLLKFVSLGEVILWLMHPFIQRPQPLIEVNNLL